MHRKKIKPSTSRTAPTLQLGVQYAVVVPDWLTRSRLRGWVRTAQQQPMQLTLRFVGAKESRVLNAAFRGKDYATNVLTFSYHDAGAEIAQADIVVCVPVVQREAKEQKKLLAHHYAHMIVHAVLHAQGYDHETAQQATEMEALEVALLQRMRIDNPYAAGE